MYECIRSDYVGSSKPLAFEQVRILNIEILKFLQFLILMSSTFNISFPLFEDIYWVLHKAVGTERK